MKDICNYSFFDLYKAAFGHKVPLKKKIKFQTLTLEETNSLVAQWTKRAGWKTKNRKGTDGRIYLSFHP